MNPALCRIDFFDYSTDKYVHYYHAHISQILKRGCGLYVTYWLFRMNLPNSKLAIFVFKR